MAPMIEDSSIIHGVVYFAAFRKDGGQSAVPYVVAAVYPKKERGSITYNRLLEIAHDEGRGIYCQKILEKSESRPWADLKGDFQVTLQDYWSGVRVEYAKTRKGKKGDKEPPRPIILESLYTFESFLKFIFREGGLVNQQVQAKLKASSDDVPTRSGISVPDNYSAQVDTFGGMQEQPGYGVGDRGSSGELQGYGGYDQGYAYGVQVYEEGAQPQAAHDLRGAGVYDPVHNISDVSDEEARAKSPEVVFGEEHLDSPVRPAVEDLVMEALDQAEVDMDDFEQEVQFAVDNENLRQLLAKATSMAKEANARTKEANAKNRATTKKKEDAEKRVECLELQIREYDGASVSSLVPGLIPVLKREMSEVTTRVVKKEVELALESFKFSAVTSLGQMFQDECGPMKETLKAVMGGMDILVRNQGQSKMGGTVGPSAVNNPATPRNPPALGLPPPPASLPKVVAVAPPVPRPVPAPAPPSAAAGTPRGRSLGMGILGQMPQEGFHAAKVAANYVPVVPVGFPILNPPPQYPPPPTSETPPPSPGASSDAQLSFGFGHPAGQGYGLGQQASCWGAQRPGYQTVHQGGQQGSGHLAGNLVARQDEHAQQGGYVPPQQGGYLPPQQGGKIK